jgi:hypothetical protein
MRSSSRGCCMAWGEVATDDTQRQRCRLQWPTFKVHTCLKRWSRVELGCGVFSSLYCNGHRWGARDRHQAVVRCRDLQGIQCYFLWLEVFFLCCLSGPFCCGYVSCVTYEMNGTHILNKYLHRPIIYLSLNWMYLDTFQQEILWVGGSTHFSLTA